MRTFLLLPGLLATPPTVRLPICPHRARRRRRDRRAERGSVSASSVAARG